MIIRKSAWPLWQAAPARLLLEARLAADCYTTPWDIIIWLKPITVEDPSRADHWYVILDRTCTMPPALSSVMSADESLRNTNCAYRNDPGFTNTVRLRVGITGMKSKWVARFVSESLSDWTRSHS
ncbi:MULTISPECIES: hypothetical protein [Sinorhizobium/Ensifer group]|uniref:hypothetical protein n=1 Tax=Sinorhizobium/Ensifer group TaxID=227292 RepID=UPI000A05ABF6|nr:MULTISPECIES: hypothetical protein [Sinorhizobium]MCK3781282.1 hypothetical protein [Ensifer sesbaniae]